MRLSLRGVQGQTNLGACLATLCINLTKLWVFLSDDQFEDGIERSTFEHAIDHVITRRFGWPQIVADVVKNKYTDWTKRNDPIENRNQYVHVRFI